MICQALSSPRGPGPAVPTQAGLLHGERGEHAVDGNVDGRPGKIMVVRQTAGQAGETVRLEKFVVTGSLINPSQPMLTGHGNVSGRPGEIMVVHQTAGQAGETVRLEKFVVTGSLLQHSAPKAVAKK